MAAHSLKGNVAEPTFRKVEERAAQGASYQDFTEILPADCSSGT